MADEIDWELKGEMEKTAILPILQALGQPIRVRTKEQWYKREMLLKFSGKK